MVADQIGNHQVGTAIGLLVTAQTLTQALLMSDAPRHKVWPSTVTDWQAVGPRRSPMAETHQLLRFQSTQKGAFSSFPSPGLAAGHGMTLPSPAGVARVGLGDQKQRRRASLAGHFHAPLQTQSEMRPAISQTPALATGHSSICSTVWAVRRDRSLCIRACAVPRFTGCTLCRCGSSPLGGF